MRGYSIMTDEERQSILKQHATQYDGYAVKQNTSNLTPLTVYDAAGDKEGITVNNVGNVTTYKNFAINENLGSEKILPPNPADIEAHQEIEEDINDYSPISYVKKVLNGEMSIEDAIEEMLNFNEVESVDELPDDFEIEFTTAVSKPCFKFSQKWIDFMMGYICDEIHGILDDVDGEEKLMNEVKAAINKHIHIDAINNEIPKIFYSGKEFTMNKTQLKEYHE